MENTKKSWAEEVEEEEEMRLLEEGIHIDHGIFSLLFNFVILRTFPKSILCTGARHYALYRFTLIANKFCPAVQKICQLYSTRA